MVKTLNSKVIPGEIPPITRYGTITFPIFSFTVELGCGGRRRIMTAGGGREGRMEEGWREGGKEIGRD